MNSPAYVCPRCKAPLDRLVCEPCGASYALLEEDIPCFLPDAASDSGHRVREIYDEIYRHHRDVWVDQGRSQPFLRYVSELVAGHSSDNVLEIGCGEGAQLAVLDARRKFGIDPSVHALVRARQRSGAACAVARAEELPFPAQSMDLVLAIGVMEHFENPDAAAAEIRRVLTPAGHYIALIHTDMTLWERVAVKVRAFVLPRPHPIALLRWVTKKLFHPIVQPLRRSYTVAGAREILARKGLHVTRVVTLDSDPQAPLAGRHVVILVAGPERYVRGTTA
jgi:ubiquinone/menaquinone biosynthesis C-methylase UbiE